MSTEKLRDSDHFKWFRRKHEGEETLINSRWAFLRTFPIWTGARVVDVCALGLSLRSKTDRNKLRRIGQRLIQLADQHEDQTTVHKR